MFALKTYLLANVEDETGFGAEVETNGQIEVLNTADD
ncbi:hypothetical protein LSPH24S_01631 [Lysinibacillus sphaericus]